MLIRPDVKLYCTEKEIVLGGKEEEGAGGKERGCGIVVWAFMEYLPTRINTTGPNPNKVFQMFLEDLRPRFLNKLPPFASDSSKRIVSSFKIDDEEMTNDHRKYHKITLIKLQSLLCWRRLPGVCAVEVYQFLKRHPQLYGNLSLLVLCMPVNEVTNIIMDFCPQALLQCAEVGIKMTF
ncbi:unnamed protein product [Timema podura]|uniref:Uncharacterized protein n=1 Tax=Timema podura TaxID=61482 RepID=A0ABN7PK77_TIMPD|nr:unnamed protein product [Timema podura]